MGGDWGSAGMDIRYTAFLGFPPFLAAKVDETEANYAPGGYSTAAASLDSQPKRMTAWWSCEHCSLRTQTSKCRLAGFFEYLMVMKWS